MYEICVVSPNSWVREGIRYLLHSHGTMVISYASIENFMKDFPKNSIKDNWGVLFHIASGGGKQSNMVHTIQQNIHYIAQECRTALLVDSSSLNPNLICKWLNIPNVYSLDKGLVGFSLWIDSLMQRTKVKENILKNEISPFLFLTYKELIVTQATLRGISMAILGRQLGENMKTLHSRRMNAIRKLGLKSTRELQLMGANWSM